VNIPLIDLRRWRDGDTSLAVELDKALRESGFLLVDGHGVDRTLAAEVRAAARRFFHLPGDRKAAYATAVGGRGWIPPGREANAYYGAETDRTRADLKESFTAGRAFRTGDPGVDDVWFARNVWPVEVPELRVLCAAYEAALWTVYTELLDMCAVALGLERTWFVHRTRRSPFTLNLNRYPPLSETGPARDGQFRIAPHTDWGVLTILDRQVGYGGLQVLTTDGRWEDAPHVENALTVNIGDLMARWTGDRWRSTRHRVLPPSDRAPDEELISLILFLEADVDTVVEPLPGGERTYPPVTVASYLRERADAATVA
jgi:isopenicillin N synthase-like dioxygenase